MLLADLDVYDRRDNYGNPIEYKEELAISNAIVHFLLLKKGDLIEDVETGGILDSLLFKSMNTINPDILSNTISNNLEYEFRGIISVNQVLVNPNFEKNQWEIAITYTYIKNNSVNGLQLNYDKNKVASNNSPVILGEIDIPYSGKNLYIYLTTIIDSQPRSNFEFDKIRNMYIWGKFSFSQLTASDPYFSDIQSLLRN